MLANADRLENREPLVRLLAPACGKVERGERGIELDVVAAVCLPGATDLVPVLLARLVIAEHVVAAIAALPRCIARKRRGGILREHRRFGARAAIIRRVIARRRQREVGKEQHTPDAPRGDTGNAAATVLPRNAIGERTPDDRQRRRPGATEHRAHGEEHRIRLVLRIHEDLLKELLLAQPIHEHRADRRDAAEPQRHVHPAEGIGIEQVEDLAERPAGSVHQRPIDARLEGGVLIAFGVRDRRPEQRGTGDVLHLGAEVSVFRCAALGDRVPHLPIEIEQLARARDGGVRLIGIDQHDVELPGPEPERAEVQQRLERAYTAPAEREVGERSRGGFRCEKVRRHWLGSAGGEDARPGPATVVEEAVPNVREAADGERQQR